MMIDQNNNAPTAALRLIPMPEVRRLTSLGRSTVYSMIEAGTFPRQRNVTPTRVAWVEAEVLQWIARVIEQPADMHPASATTTRVA